MFKHHSRLILLTLMSLIVTVISIQSQSSDRVILTLWTFNESRDFERNDEIDSEYYRHEDPSTLVMTDGDIDSDGGNGTTYTDMCNIEHERGNAIEWNDVRGDDEDNRDDDAQFEMAINTTDWEQLAFRFFYKTDNVESFDLSYHLGDGNWKLIADDVVIDDFDEWNNIEVDMSDVTAINNRSIVVLLVHDLTRNGRDELRIDNVAVIGKRISAPIDCSPTLTPLSSMSDIAIILTQDRDKSFTGENGIQFQVSDDNTSIEQLTIAALSSNPNIISQLSLIPIDSAQGIFRFDMGTAHGGVGIADIILRVSDSSGNVTQRVIQYAVSDIATSSTTFYHFSTANASAAVALDDTYMLVANDDNQILNVYNRNQSGAPLATFDLADMLELEDQRGDGTYPEVDIESVAQIGTQQVWIGSHSNTSNGRERPNRQRLFATQVSGQGANTQIAFVGYYDKLLRDLVEWGNDNGYNFRRLTRRNRGSEDIDALNIEGFTIAPDGQTAFIAFRVPLVPVDNRTRALIAPIHNFATWFNNGDPDGKPAFGNPIELNLDERGIRAIECNVNGCLIVAGPIATDGDFAIYSWTGNPTELPIQRSANLTSMLPEALLIPIGTNFANGTTVQLLSDMGDIDLYQSGSVASSLLQSLQFFRSDYVVIE